MRFRAFADEGICPAGEIQWCGTSSSSRNVSTGGNAVSSAFTHWLLLNVSILYGTVGHAINNAGVPLRSRLASTGPASPRAMAENILAILYLRGRLGASARRNPGRSPEKACRIVDIRDTGLSGRFAA